MCKGKIRIHKLLPFFGIILVLSSHAFAQERAWQTFSPDNGEWSISAPGVMTPDKEALESPSIMGSYSYGDAKSFFAVIYRDTPKGRILWKPFKKAHFKKVRKGFVKSSNGELLKVRDFSSGNFTGQEVYIKVPDGRVMSRESRIKTKYRIQRLRMFFDERRFYILIAVLPEGEIDSPVADNYFNSFVVN